MRWNIMLMVAWLLLACSACQHGGAPRGPYSVGVTTRYFTDGPAQQPLITEIWYPTTHALDNIESLYCGAYIGHATRDAALHEGGPYPLVVLSHGKYGTRYDLSWLAESLAAQGYIVAAANHPGSDVATYVDSEASKLWVRAGTLTRVIDDVLQERTFGAAVDVRRIGAVGYSLGGSTVLVLGGAHIDAERFAKYFPQSGLGDEQPQRDDRVRAVVAIAPGTARAFTADGVEPVQVPALIVSAGNDRDAPEDRNARFFAKHIRLAVWDSVPKAQHTTFQPTCSGWENLFNHRVCSDPWGVDRDIAHAQVDSWVQQFLRGNLE